MIYSVLETLVRESSNACVAVVDRHEQGEDRVPFSGPLLAER